jgi:hypothetical protein
MFDLLQNQLTLSSQVMSAATEGFNGFLRGHSGMLDIIRRTMNPKEQSLFKGNIGRYNFDGSGPDGSYQDLRVSQVGGIVSFPGAADQAIHADCPHLFEHLECLPAHYINIFAPGVPFDDKVGGTAFFHGSHNLRFTAQHCGSSDDYQNVYPFLVRPSLTLGDVILFDCRILHFGLTNRSDSIERVRELYLHCLRIMTTYVSLTCLCDAPFSSIYKYNAEMVP